MSRFRSLIGFLWLVALLAVGCRDERERLEPRFLTFAELRVVRSGVSVTPPGESERAPYPRERLSDGARVTVSAGGLGWLRRDAGATLLVRGPARLLLRARSVEIEQGRVFVDTPPSSTTELKVPNAELSLSQVRASVEVGSDGLTRAYVLAGEIKAAGGRAGAGELLTLSGKSATSTPAIAWDDWTGGLATTDRAAAPAPFGVGTVGARAPGEQGAPRFPLAIQRMDVRVSIDGDFALTEVDQTFFNPSSSTVEGLYGFRTPERAILHRFGVDRGGVLVFGRVKERQAAAAQYRQNVYEGSTEDPALLEWDAPGSYRARLYPIGPGESRRVVMRYGEWLDRTGAGAKRRLYVFPMAADGSEDSLPHIEELKVSFDLSRARTNETRVGMAGTREGDSIVVRAQDHVPRADLALELFDDGPGEPRAFTARHVPDLDALPPPDRDAAAKAAREEADYVLVPVRAEQAPLVSGGLDLVIVVDSSAATEPAALGIARAATAALLAQLGDADRALVWAGAESVRPVVADWKVLSKVDEPARRRVLAALASLERGGATDLGGMLASAAGALDPQRRGAVVYIGDGAPTVGELGLKDLRARLDKLPRPVQVFALGIGDEANLALLEGLSRGAFAERVSDAHQAARAALRLLEIAERPVWLGTKIELGPNVERVQPRDTSALVSDQTLLLLGRRVGDKSEARLKLEGPGGARELVLALEPFDDHGDLRRRWAEERLRQMLDEGEGRAAMVELGSRNGIVTPVTSFYVPTKNEMGAEERQELERRRQARGKSKESSKPPSDPGEEEPEEREAAPVAAATRAKGDEGSTGKSAANAPAQRYAVAGPKDDDAKPKAASGEPVKRIVEGDAPASSDDKSAAGVVRREPAAPLPEKAPEPMASAPAAQPSTPDEVLEEAPRARGNMWGADTSLGAAGLGLTGVGEGGGGRAEGTVSGSAADALSSGLGMIGTLGHGAGTGQGFGSGHGRLGGSKGGPAPKVTIGAAEVTGALPPQVIQRIVRQNFGRFRMCYEQGLTKNPNLQGRVVTRFVIGKRGAVTAPSNSGSDLPDLGVQSCVINSFAGLTFPEPDTAEVSVVVPVVFIPPSGEPLRRPLRASGIEVTVKLGDLPRWLRICSAAASAPLEERVALWRERLAPVAGNPGGARAVYRNALKMCEAPTWRERSRLLSLLLDAMRSVTQRVQLWRAMYEDFGVADAIYRGILARVKTPEQRRELSAALGLKTMDASLLKKLLDAAKNPAERVTKLSKLWFEWPDDFNIALALLDALEDVGDDGAARELARKLRARPDADARLRTAVGELHLRLAVRAKQAHEKEADVLEARRAFGEIVEFAPDDPVARRRLGDLLRAHGWFSDAQRQYETLARLAPDDSSVPLLLGAAAEGRGLLEEATKWAEKGGAAGAPDATGGAAAAARALSATWLAWGRLSAKNANKTAELQALSARAERVLAPVLASQRSGKKSVRAALSWSHPELHVALFSDALGAPMPAPEGDVTLGIAQVMMGERDRALLEVRLEPGDVELAARLGAEAVLTVVFDELGPAEKIVRLPVKFARGGPSTLRFVLADQEVKSAAL